MGGRVERFLGEVMGAAGRYWPVSAAVVSAVGSFGLPETVDTTNRLVLFAAGFVVFTVAFLMGKRSGKDESAKTAREAARRDFDMKAKDLRHSYDLRLVEHDRAHDREIQELKRAHDSEAQELKRSRDLDVASLKKMVEDADRDGEADAARARELESFKRRAEIDLRELERLRNEFDIDRFSPAQLSLMLRCLEAERSGKPGIVSSTDDPVADSLENIRVLYRSSGPVNARWNYVYMLEPDWRRFVSENEGEIERTVERSTQLNSGERSRETPEREK